MLNRYPLWKNLMVVFTLIIGLLYALPNVYGEDPAIQISGARGASADMSTLDAVTEDLKQNNISYKSVAFENGTVLVRFNDTDTQISARDILNEELGDKFVVALNLAPSTPKWLQSIGASPMKLGLDLRGGVHFLMEVDMDAAMEKLLSQQEETFRTELREAKIRYGAISKTKDAVEVRLRDAEQLNEAEKALEKLHPDMIFVEKRNNVLSATFTDAVCKRSATTLWIRTSPFYVIV
ncbi:protein-export membrane protein SecD [Photobacterium aphoticum]|uniref:Protein-export membrane protein SecD n=1 Tax=Photobacterium aphoticum TaxID=754436 RepID=A0A090R3B7_9GAMM|nr:protein-export membrane protein SecD [Photobacterium aphoticum]